MPNNRTSKYVMQKLMDLQGERDKPTTIFGDFNTLYQKCMNPAGRKISKATVELNNIKQLDISNIY